MQAIQKRVGATTQVLGSIKSMKMLGLAAKMTDIVQDLRVTELQKSKKFRKVQITNIILGKHENCSSLPACCVRGFDLLL